MKKTVLFTFFVLIIHSVLSQPVVHVSPLGAGNRSGDSWTNALPGTDLPNRVATATAGTQFWVAAGTYKPTMTTDRAASFSIASGVSVYGGFAGTETALRDRVLTQPSSTTFSGEISSPEIYDNSIHVLTFKNADSTTRLENIIIAGGNANISSGWEYYNSYSNYGGGILNISDNAKYSSPRINRCHITGNKAEIGGGIFSTVFGENTESIQFTECDIGGNIALYNGGGAFIVGGSTSFMNCRVIAQ